jgi:hypothetical protein
MKIAEIQEKFASAEEHIATLAAQIALQREILAELERDGGQSQTRPVVHLLSFLEERRAQLMAERDRLRDLLADRYRLRS